MQSLNVLRMVMVFLIQGKAAHANTPNNFGCLDKVPNYPVAACVASGPGDNQVKPMVAPWNPDIKAYDCTKADPKSQRASCCPAPNWAQYLLSVGVWKLVCREIDGAEIQKY
ncbi:hypothetical protein MJO29_012959 [Puccinia striiformis f. sp. tritici]|nr:hypothetical protein Pst134EB_025094 [Puccinia striiformis f. sp. tritici]KAI7943115.1 hypothetical protein MJO29_012959 [Puccinia striiformis f. sp. tritici]KAI9619591.1 hypothetical protein KEM48_006237 [Puccinia striiformis f. sp. tritici PST-130]